MKTLAEHAARLRHFALFVGNRYPPMSLGEPEIGDELRETADALEQAAEVLRAVEWRGVAPDRHSWLEDAHCVGCEHSQPNGHAPDCKLAALIGATDKPA